MEIDDDMWHFSVSETILLDVYYADPLLRLVRYSYELNHDAGFNDGT